MQESLDNASNVSTPGQTEEEAPLVNRWPPPVIPQEKTFSARVTHVTDMGQLYLQKMEDVNMLRSMRRQLNKTYVGDALEQDVQVNTDWVDGQECIAQYAKDEWWYRARIIKILDKKKVAVLFVDYGNISSVLKKNLRPARDFGSQTIFAVRFILSKTISRRHLRWSNDELDEIHRMIHYESCGSVKVTVTGRNKELPLEGEIKFRVDNKGEYVDFSEYLIKQGIARRQDVNLPIMFKNEYLEDAFGIMGVADSSSSECSTSTTENSSSDESLCPSSVMRSCPSPFKSNPTRFKAGDTFGVSVQVVFYTGTCCFHLRNGDERDFAQFTQDFSEKAYDQPPAVIKVGSAVAVKHADGKWYRGQVLSNSDRDYPNVLYVDVGNFERASPRNIRQIPEEYLSAPPLFAVTAKLDYGDLTNKDGRDKKSRLDLINEQLMKGQELHFRVSKGGKNLLLGTLLVKKDQGFKDVLDQDEKRHMKGKSMCGTM